MKRGLALGSASSYEKADRAPEGGILVTIEEYNEINGYTLKHGITTGSCALAGAKAALLLLLGEETDEVCIRTPKGIGLRIPVFFSKIEGETAVCAVKKYAGDDPDCTDGISVFARVSLLETAEKPEIFLEGGEGVGRATKAGLPVPVGEAAINPVPRKMIR